MSKPKPAIPQPSQTQKKTLTISKIPKSPVALRTKPILSQKINSNSTDVK